MSSSSSVAHAQCLEAPGEPAAGLFRSPGTRTLLLSLLLAAAVLASYNPIVHNGFLRYDDDRYIVDNPHVHAGLTWNNVQWAFTTYDEANWHPLTWLSHALDYELFGPNPAGHHYMNVLLHAVNAILLFLLLQNATGFPWRSLMVAALFALHPINVESVAWAAERKTVLSMTFFLLALYAYGWYARRPGVSRYFAVAFLFALSLLSKPQVVTFPCLLLLWDYWPLQRIGDAKSSALNRAEGSVSGYRFSDTISPAARIDAPLGATHQLLPANFPQQPMAWLILEKIPLLLLSAASAVVTVKAQQAGRAVKAFSEYSLPLRVENAVIAYIRYLGKAFWPAKLVALYPHPTRLYPAWQIAGAVLLLALITALVIRARHRRYLIVGWFWFLGSLVPMIGLVQVGFQAMADRYAYIPFIGLFVMLTWLVADWAKAGPIRGGQNGAQNCVVAGLRPAGTGPSPVTTRWLAIPSVAILLVLGALTYRQVTYWHDTQSFWLRTLALTQNNFVAEDNLGEFLFNQGRADEAAAHFRAALAIRPDGLIANLNLGAYEDRRGNLPAAIEHYQMVASHAGDEGLRATAYGSLGFVYRQMGESSKAKQCFETALQLAPERARARIGLALIAQDGGDLPEAVQQYQQAVAIQSNDVTNLLLAQALQQDGRTAEAKTIYDRLAGSPDLIEAKKQVQSLIKGK